MRIPVIAFAAALLVLAACGQSNKAATSIDGLRLLGSDLSRPHTIDFSLTFKDKTAADSARADLVRQGHRTELRDYPNSPGWVVEIEKVMLPKADALSRLDSNFSQIARKHNGMYGGWLVLTETR